VIAGAGYAAQRMALVGTRARGNPGAEPADVRSVSPGSGRRFARAVVSAAVIAAVIAAVVAALAGPAAAQREPGWDVRVAERVAVAVGATGSLTISLAVDRGLTVSKDAAILLDLDPEPGVTVKKKRLGRGDAVDPEADAPRFAIAVRGEAAGEHAVRLRIRFWLCGTASCRPIDVRKVATVGVAP
jgi:hypothetical protein